MSATLKRAALLPIILGIVLIAAGIFIPTPGGALTTYSSLDGVKTESYAFDDRYSTIDEYVGGDAYNYIIGAALVAGKMSGYIVGKAIMIVCGAMCFCIGVSMVIISGGMQSKRNTSNQPRHQHLSTADVYRDGVEDDDYE